MMWHLIWWWLGGIWLLPCIILKATHVSWLFLVIECCQYLFILSVSNIITPAKDFSIPIRNGQICVWYLAFIIKKSISLFLRIYDTYQGNSGSRYIPYEDANSATFTGLYSFSSDRRSHVEVPSYHWTYIYHPLLVFFRLFLPLWVI